MRRQHKGLCLPSWLPDLVLCLHSHSWQAQASLQACAACKQTACASAQALAAVRVQPPGVGHSGNVVVAGV